MGEGLWKHRKGPARPASEVAHFEAVVATVIGVVGTGLIGMFFVQLQNLRDDLKQGLRGLGTSAPQASMRCPASAFKASRPSAWR